MGDPSPFFVALPTSQSIDKSRPVRPLVYVNYCLSEGVACTSACLPFASPVLFMTLAYGPSGRGPRWRRSGRRP